MKQSAVSLLEGLFLHVTFQGPHSRNPMSQMTPRLGLLVSPPFALNFVLYSPQKLVKQVLCLYRFLFHFSAELIFLGVRVRLCAFTVPRSFISPELSRRIAFTGPWPLLIFHRRLNRLSFMTLFSFCLFFSHWSWPFDKEGLWRFPCKW